VNSLKHFILFYPEFDVIPDAIHILTNMHPYPRHMRILDKCVTLPAFINASWEKQVDAEGPNPSK
jgi:maleylacetoacetate isomerase/maleylpyruvate isomerase